MHIDRRSYNLPSVHSSEDYQRLPSRLPQRRDDLEKTDLDEIARRICERWKYDTPPTIPLDNGFDEDDRVLVDDFQPR